MRGPSVSPPAGGGLTPKKKKREVTNGFFMSTTLTPMTVTNQSSAEIFFHINEVKNRIVGSHQVLIFFSAQTLLSKKKSLSAEHVVLLSINASMCISDSLYA